MSDTVSISSKGQVTIPKDIRDYLGLKRMDKLVFTAVKKDYVVLRRLNKDFLEFGGSVNPKNIPEDYSAIRQKVRQKIAGQVMKKG